jgi:hypothetical protein
LKIFILLAALCLSCGKDEDPTELHIPTDDVASLYAEAAARLPSFLSDGQVTSKWTDGTLEHRGDSMLMTGLAIGSLDCERGAPLMERLVRRITENEGLLERFEPYAPEISRTRYSWDQEVGVTYAFARRAARCPGESVSLAGAWKLRQAAIASWNKRLHPEHSTKVPPGFDFATKAVSHQLGLSGAPTEDNKQLMELEAIGWAATVVATRSSCYRVHLAFRSMLTAEAAGRPVDSWARDRFCAVTSSAGIPLIDRWCGRPETFLADWQWNQGEFRHQLCSYQSTGAKEGLENAGVDLLDYVATFYELAG